jgi:lipase chaperone LimK
MPASDRKRHALETGGGLAAVFVITLLVLALFSPDEETPVAGDNTATGGTASTPLTASPGRASSEVETPTVFVTGLEQLPASLEGTSVPPGLLEDGNGNLVPTPGLRDIFDYFLSVHGEESLDVIVARVNAYLASNLSASAAAQARTVLGNYLDYRESLADVDQVGGVNASQLDLLAVQTQQDEVRALRQRYFDAGANEAFFARDDALDRFAVARMQVLQNDKLSPEEQAAQLESLRQQLPTEMQQELDDVSRYQDLRALTQSWQEQGGNEADLRQIREQTVGAAAADRLEALEQERAAFDQRIQRWLGARQAILSNSALSQADRERQIETLRAQQFNDTELVRVRTLERIHDSSAP